MRIIVSLHEEDVKKDARGQLFKDLCLDDFNISEELVRMSNDIVFHPQKGDCMVLKCLGDLLNDSRSKKKKIL